MLSDFDVTIIGLGPVGSFAALLMENRGLKVLAIDRDIDIYSLPRAVSISDQGLRMAQEIDLDQIYFKNSTEVSGAEFVDKDLNRIGGTLDLKGFITSNAWSVKFADVYPAPVGGVTDEKINKSPADNP